MRPNNSRIQFSALAMSTLALVAACTPAQSDSTLPIAACELPDDALGAFTEIPAGSFLKGAQPIYPEEAPTLALQVERFWIQNHEVTNDQFAAFVADTGYVTDAEQGILDGREGAGSAVFQHPGASDTVSAPWTLEADASWQAPDGGTRSIAVREHMPVVHVSKRDAEAYATWAGGRLPSEIEWEYAASLGLPDPDTATSGAYGDGGPRANTWQGIFPVADMGSDGFRGAAPVGCFEADRIGLYDMIGNVWEWTDTPYGARTHTIKGGSYLCADNFCRRYRPAARQPQETDFSSSHIGFRIVRDAPPEGADET